MTIKTGYRVLQHAALITAPGTGTGCVYAIMEALRGTAADTARTLDSDLEDASIPLPVDYDEQMDQLGRELNRITAWRRVNWDTIWRVEGYTARARGRRWGARA